MFLYQAKGKSCGSITIISGAGQTALIKLILDVAIESYVKVSKKKK
jgi:hypothetical protein